MNHNLQIDSLSEERAYALLSSFVNSSMDQTSIKGFSLQDESLISGLHNFASKLADGDGESVAHVNLNKQALKVIAEDPLFRSELYEFAESNENHLASKPTHFSLDATSIISSTTIALTVLSTYLDIKKDKQGKWTFHFKLMPSSDGIKKELIKFISSLVGVAINKK